MKKLDGTRRTSSAGQRAAADRPHVLYIEDEDDNWDVAELRLKERYRLHRARTDREACRKLATLGPHLRAVLMDIELKGSELDGIALTRLLRGGFDGVVPDYAEQVPVLDVPVIFVTAYAWSFPEEQLIQAGGNTLITKPVDFVRLNLALARVSANEVLDA